MAQDKTTLYNLALSTAGIHNFVSLPDENSHEAQVCNLWYPTVRDIVFRAAFWPDLKKSIYLAVHEDRTDGEAWAAGDPEPGWLFAYKYPADCLYPRFLADYSKFSTGSADDGTKLITTSCEDAILTYTKKTTNLESINVDLFSALVYALGSVIAMPLHSKLKFAQLAKQEANDIIRNARANDANLEDFNLESLPESIAVRGYDGAAGRDRFLYPYGSLIASVGGASVN